MTDTSASGRYDRIPPPLDLGRSSESCMSYLWAMFKNHKDYDPKSGDFPETDEGVRYACGLPIPEFQRDLCWDHEQEIAFIESAWIGITLGSYTHHYLDWGEGGKPKRFSGWVIDGQQRLTTIERYWRDEFKVFDLYYSELRPIEQRRFMSIKFVHYESRLDNEEAIRDLYNRLAFGGTPHAPDEKALRPR